MRRTPTSPFHRFLLQPPVISEALSLGIGQVIHISRNLLLASKVSAKVMSRFTQLFSWGNGGEAEWRCELYPDSNPGASKNGDGLTCAKAEIQDRFAPVLDRTFESAARFNGNGDLTAR